MGFGCEDRRKERQRKAEGGNLRITFKDLYGLVTPGLGCEKPASKMVSSGPHYLQPVLPLPQARPRAAAAEEKGASMEGKYVLICRTYFETLA